MTTYTYFTLYRPPSPGCQPSDGLIEALDYSGKRPVTENKSAWGEVTYNRPLTDKEILDYELHPSPLNEQPLPKTPVQSHHERRRAAVYATGNKWAIENFEATH